MPPLFVVVGYMIRGQIIVVYSVPQVYCSIGWVIICYDDRYFLTVIFCLKCIICSLNKQGHTKRNYRRGPL